VDEAYFARLGASQLAKTICAAPTTEVARGMYGKVPGVPFEEYGHARCIVVWGANPRTSNIHLMPFLREAKRRGAFIAVVDPARNLVAREADLHLPVYPGADLPLALGLIRLWCEWDALDRSFLDTHATGLETLLAQADAWPLARAAAEARVDPGAMERLARVYLESSPAVVRCGWGIERNRNGGQAVAAVLAMPALLGKFGVRGGGYTLSNSGFARLKRNPALARPRPGTRAINMTELGVVLAGDRLDPPIAGLFVYNANPAVTVPDQNAVLRGLARDDLFTVVHDQVLTDTARYADILLPATTFLEHYDVRIGYGNAVVGGVRPVVPRAGEARPNLEVFGVLGRAMGWDDAAFGWDEVTAFRRVAAALRVDGTSVDADRLLEGGTVAPSYDGSAVPVLFGNVRPRTPDERVHLTPSALGDAPYRYEAVSHEAYPLALVSPASGRTVSSTLAETGLPDLYAELHPADARRRGLADGDRVRVHNALGEVRCRLRVADRVRPGVLWMPKGAWCDASPNGRTATALSPAHVNVVGGGACFYDARVEVEKAISQVRGPTSG
jgi:anaerobic selenocysteine-containing dehydrogenase